MSEDVKIRRTEIAVSRALQFGVVGSLIIILSGVIWAFINRVRTRTSSRLERHLITKGAHYPHTLSSLWHGLLSVHPSAFVTLGLALFILTPLFRVLVSLILFWMQKDRHFVAITSFVLAVLVASFFLGTVSA
jgi:uncharacterized membrane protein